ncbi:MAG: CopG family transcriptional regulator [Nitrospirae bacterium]|nr:CopG family transcriptional regulator [Nitrospirota bacterium]
MPSRQRVVMTLSVPPDTAKEYRKLAKTKGETISQLFREVFTFYKEEKLREDFFELQRYGAKKRRELRLTEKDIEKLIFEGR